MKQESYLFTTTTPQQTAGIARRITPYHRFRRRLPCEKIRQKSTGKELDRETGLYYFGARYLDPRTSRWLSVDPAIWQGDFLPSAPINDEARERNQNLPNGGVFNTINLHVFNYSNNNPVRYVDPDGRIPIPKIIDLAIAYAPKIIDGLKIAGKAIWNTGKKIFSTAPKIQPAASSVQQVANKRDTLLNAVQNPALRSTVDQLYRPGATIGDGGTAAMLRHEIQTGRALTHLEKAQGRIKNLENIIRTQDLSLGDLQIANNLLNDLRNAVNLVNP